MVSIIESQLAWGTASRYKVSGQFARRMAMLQLSNFDEADALEHPACLVEYDYPFCWPVTSAMALIAARPRYTERYL